MNTEASETGFTVWLTGMSGTGTSSLANPLATELADRRLKVEVLGDADLDNQSRSPSFTGEDDDTKARRIGWGCELLNRNGVVAIAAVTTPAREVRDEVRALVGRFVEVHIDVHVDVPDERGAKSPDPELTIRTDGTERPEESVARIVARLEELGHLPRRDADVGAAAYTADEESEVTDRLRDLGYL